MWPIEGFYGLQVDFLSSIPRIEGITNADSIADDVVGVLLTSIPSDIWSSLQVLEEKIHHQNLLRDTSEDHRIKRKMISKT